MMNLAYLRQGLVKNSFQMRVGWNVCEIFLWR